MIKLKGNECGDGGGEWSEDRKEKEREVIKGTGRNE